MDLIGSYLIALIYSGMYWLLSLSGSPPVTHGERNALCSPFAESIDVVPSIGVRFSA